MEWPGNPWNGQAFHGMAAGNPLNNGQSNHGIITELSGLHQSLNTSSCEHTFSIHFHEGKFIVQ